MDSTLSIPLSTSWTNSTVVVSAVNRGESQLNLSSEILWTNNNSDSNSFYVFGGEDLEGTASQQDPPLWEFTADGSGGGSWAQASTDSTYDSLNQPTHALGTSGNALGFALGGAEDCATYAVGGADCGGSQIPVPGLVMFNMTTGSFSNISAASGHGISTTGTAYNGGAEFAPNFGAEGVAVFFGGQSSPSSTIDGDSPTVSLGRLAIFDPSTQAWYSQQATGDNIPSDRNAFCSVGVQGGEHTVLLDALIEALANHYAHH